jgi:predicted membrane-bound spermidine synthase
LSQWLLLSVACATGAAVMIIELMGVRLMAPWFGQSQLVWTNVIGVVLASLAVGQWLGGRWAEYRRHPRPTTLLIAAGALSIASPDLVRLVSPLVLPADLSLDEAYPFVTLGSLLVAFVAVGVPMLAMGAVAPWLVRLSREASEAPGRVAGAILAAGTLGSLLGTFGATHVLLGAFGSALTVRFAGGLLLVAGLVLAVGNGGAGRAGLLMLLVPAVTIPWPSRAREAHVLEHVATPYQDARVELDPDGTRLLRINEGLDSFHSAYRPGDLWTDRYFDAFVVPALMAPEGDDGSRSVCVIGLGGGTMARQVQVVIPDAKILGIEIDDMLIGLGRKWFGLPESVSVAGGVDGRLALHVVQEPFGAILIDAYSQQIYLPPHLCTREFSREELRH